MLIGQAKLKTIILATLSLQILPESEGLKCDEDRFSCANDASCIPSSFICDGDDDCGDGSDERHRNDSLTYPNETAFCRGKYGRSKFCVLPSSHKSRRDLICEQKLGCNVDQFSCRDGITCIDLNLFCDERNDCPDNSDENYRNESLLYPNETAFCRAKYGRKFCPVPSSMKTRRYLICEQKFGCDDDQFPCRDNITCTDLNFFCDGRKDCADGSDERYRDVTISYHHDTKFCRRKGQTYKNYICELPSELPAKTDLCHESFECDEDQFTCTHGGRCIPLSYFCNGGDDCGDNSDDLYRSNSLSYPNQPIFCSSRYSSNRWCLIPSSFRSRRNLICEQKLGCNENQFSCQDGITCIDLNFFCDGWKDCPDNSDEPKNPEGNGRICDAIDLRNSEKRCLLPEELVCELQRNESNRINCKDEIDECLCTDGISRLCDGIIDCSDLSDECFCRRKPQVCHNIIWNEKLKPRLTCASNKTTFRMPIESICDRSEECTDGVDEANCSLDVMYGSSLSQANQRNVQTSTKKHKCQGENKYATRCDGVPECQHDIYIEECLCNDKPKFCNHLRTGYRWFSCETKVKKSAYGDYNKLFGYEVCNGQLNCEGMEDEKSCPNNTRFYCGKEPLPNIPKTKRCDKLDDCENGTDELNCNHFHCKDGGSVKYLDEKNVCDGNQDCAEGSDECQPSCIKSSFSNEKSMIKHKGFSVMVAVFGFIAFAGNVIVTFLMIRLLKRLFKRKNRDKKTAKLTAILIMNLSISDLLVGIYILAIFAKTVEVEGKYCVVDREWRSSLACSFLGALLVVGSEESVFTMIFITIMRMRVVLWPQSNLFLKSIALIILGTWTLSLAIALAPLAPLFEDYFVDSVWYRNSTLFTTIEKKEVVTLTNWLSFYFEKENNSDKVRSWGKLEELIRNIDPNLIVAQKYGFYSTHAVCLPTFLPNRKTDTAWAYSLVMILLNCIAFFVIAIGYGITFKEATKPSTAIQNNSDLTKRREKQNKRMQRKLIRIVASDFLCWIPVSFMAFLQVAGVDIPTDAYLPIGLIIIPINSALNPFLYSDLPDMIWEKLSLPRMWIYRICCLPIRNMYAEIRGKTQIAVPVDDVEGADRHQVLEMQVIERGSEVVEENMIENSETKKSEEVVAECGIEIGAEESNHDEAEQSQKWTVADVTVLNEEFDDSDEDVVTGVEQYTHDEDILDQVEIEETKDQVEEMKEDETKRDSEKSGGCING